MVTTALVPAVAASPPPLTSWRWRPPVAGAAARANPPLALALSAAASRRPALPELTLKYRAFAAGARTQCSVAPLGGVETERDAPDWGALVRGLALSALGCSVLGCGAAMAAEDSIKASGFGLRVAASLRRLGWPDEAVVFTLATLPVIELRGAIPVGYWMRLDPVRLTVLSVLGFVLLILSSPVTSSFGEPCPRGV
ncbi:hypothetical protein GUJ93_ZPchr0003g17105 [Zizania palustris]|uniref:Uncharacterized protein n=1 Tax=Zizania palustris TaxID=103762 RepID=A0A8J5V5T1_ZIZPA|nr:hypothetical protein GUJ93_ZPchr0003g17105 [Zizania palustris]